MTTNFLRAALAAPALIAGIAAIAGSAHAATVNFSEWAYGDSWGHVVNVTSPADIGPAGGFKGTVTFNGNENGFTGSINAFISYCVEIPESFYLASGDMTGYQVLKGADYAEWTNANGNGKSAAETTARLGQLLSYVADNGAIRGATAANDSTSLQLAIWNVVYDTDDTVAGGIFRETSVSAYSGYADALLGASAGWGKTFDVFVLQKSGSQDFVLTNGVDRPVTKTSNEVPEPTTLVLSALALLALLGVGAARLRNPR